MDDIGIWPRFRGRAMHDRWISYDAYAGAHSLCGAHLLRDCLYLAEQEQQTWAAEMADHLLAMHHAAQEWRLQGARCVPPMERDEWVTHYFEILMSGYAAQPPAVEAEVIKRRGRQKQSAAKNLLDHTWSEVGIHIPAVTIGGPLRLSGQVRRHKENVLLVLLSFRILLTWIENGVGESCSVPVGT